MRPDDLQRFVRPSCASCKSMAPECYVNSVALCWVCAHAVMHHGMKLGELIPDCTCEKHTIFPSIELDRAAKRKQIAGYVEDPSQKTGPAKPPDNVFTMVSPSYNLDGTVDRTGPVFEQRYRKLDGNRVEIVSAKVRERTRGELISRTRKARVIRAVTR